MKRRPFKWPFNTQIRSNFPATPKVELSESPPPLTQKYIDEVITALQTPPPNIGGHGQPALTTQDLLCTKCHSTIHIAEACTIEPIIQRICFYCGEPNHMLKNALIDAALRQLLKHPKNLQRLLNQPPHMSLMALRKKWRHPNAYVINDIIKIRSYPWRQQVFWSSCTTSTGDPSFFHSINTLAWLLSRGRSKVSDNYRKTSSVYYKVCFKVWVVNEWFVNYVSVVCFFELCECGVFLQPLYFNLCKKVCINTSKFATI